MTRRMIVVAGAVIALVLGVRATAHAHAMLVSAEPAAGSHLPSSPTRIRLVFSEELELSLARLGLTDASGRSVKLVAGPDPRDVRAMVAPIAPLAPGGYRIDWHIVSADGHPVDGTYTFFVGSDTLSAAPPPTAAMTMDMSMDRSLPVVASLVRGVALGALMMLTGWLWFVTTEAADRVPRGGGNVRWLAVITCLLLAANVLAWARHATMSGDLTADALRNALSTGTGRVLLAATGCALLAVWALWLAQRPRIAAFFAACGVVIAGANGHPAAIHPYWTIPAKSVHLLATSVWLGGVTWLLTRIRAGTGRLADDARRVSRAALVAALLVIASGAAQTFAFLPSLADLFRTLYGAVVLAKLACYTALIAYGARHRYRMMPRIASEPGMPARFASSLRQEFAVMAVVILLGAALSNISPSRETARSASPSPGQKP